MTGFELEPAPPGEARPRGLRRSQRQAAEVLAAEPLLERPQGLGAASTRLHLGTSSWSFPGWKGLVYAGEHQDAVLARRGLHAYSRHPLLDAVGIDRGFYAPLTLEQYADYASQTPAGFRFLVKAPDLVTGATVRDSQGRPGRINPTHLDADSAIEFCVRPCRDGLGDKLGALVFQFSPLPRDWLSRPVEWIDRLATFLSKLPPGLPYAVELRDAELLTPRLMRMLAEHRVGYCLGLHARMPPLERQLRALDALHAAAGSTGPLVARWSLHAGLGYVAAKARYAPFNRLVDPDPATREALAARAAEVLADGQQVIVTANNKAEGSAPLTLQALARSIAHRIGADD